MAASADSGVTIPSGGVVPVKIVTNELLRPQRIKVNLPALVFGITAASGGAADAQGQKLFELPAGTWQVLGSSFDFTVTTQSGLSVATAVFSLGTAAATADDATLSSTEANVCASQTLGDGTLAGGASETEDTVVLGTGSAVANIGDTDGTTTPVYFNIAGTFTHASDVTCDVTIDGDIELIVLDLGVGVD
jgi:hypothetical protein